MGEFLKKKLEKWKKDGRLLMECVAGSHLYNLQTPSSDMDIRGVFAPSLRDLMLCGIMPEDPDEVSDDLQDTKFYSFPKFIELASNCNPNIIELLFVPNEKMNFSSKAWNQLILHRDLFISKKALYTFSGYAYAQIKKSRGQGKKANSVEKYVNEDGVKAARMLLSQPSDGSTMIAQSELNRQTLERFYGQDFVKFLEKERVEYSQEYFDNVASGPVSTMGALIMVHLHHGLRSMLPPSFRNFIYWYRHDDNGFPFRQIAFDGDLSEYDASRVEGCNDLYRLYHHGKGFIDDNGMNIILKSIEPERERCDFAGVVRVNIDEYNKEKREYDSFWEWMANRNEERYANCWDNNKTCDMKNLMHCVRLLICAESIALYGRPIVEFKGEDREFLMKIRRGEEDADEILDMAEEKMKKLEDLFKASSIPESIDRKKICSMLLKDVYPEIYGMNF